MIGQVFYSESLCGGHYVKRHFGDESGVLDPVLDRQTGNAHVGVADRLDLVDVVEVDDGVEGRVEVVEQGHDLHRGQGRAEGSEADDVREEDGH